MKLYTENQVKTMIEKSRETGLTAEYLILTTNGIELSSDEEISEEGQKQWGNVHSVGLVGWFDGAKWMRDKIQGGNK